MVPAPSAPPPAPRALAFGPFVYDLWRDVLRCGDRAIALPARELAVLRRLLVHSGRTLSSDELLADVWTSAGIASGNPSP